MTGTDKLQIRIPGMNGDQPPPNLPQTRTTKFELLFANNQSVYQKATDESDDMDNNEGGVHFRVMMPGSDDIIYKNFSKGEVVAQRELGPKTFLISDSIPKTAWKISDETKTIAGYACKKATSERMQKSIRIENTNGQMTSQEFTDTLHITAWYSDQIPVSAGPDMYGGLPGVILLLDINNGRTVFTATNVSAKVDASDVSEPKSGKKVSQKQFEDERQKMFDEMQKNNPNKSPAPPNTPPPPDAPPPPPPHE